VIPVRGECGTDGAVIGRWGRDELRRSTDWNWPCLAWPVNFGPMENMSMLLMQKFNSANGEILEL